MPSVTLTGGKQMVSELARISKQVKAGTATTVNVGFLQDATYPDGQQVAQVAFWQEFGTTRIPSRPFFRNAIKANKDKWGETFGKLLKANNYNVDKTLALMGMGIKGQVQQSIIDLLAPPLSAVTIMLRKMRMDNPDLVVTLRTVFAAARKVRMGDDVSGANTKPLVDTGVMLNSVDYEVK